MKQRKLLSALLLTFAGLMGWLVLLPGCGGSATIHTPDPASQPVPGAQRLSSGAFTVDVLPETFIGGGRAGSLGLTHYTESGTTVVELATQGAQALKGVFVELHYNARRFHPLNVDPAVALAQSPELLRLDVLQDPGVVSSGQVIAAYEGSPGVDGDRLLLRLRFADGPAPLVRKASTPPGSPLSKAELFYSAADGLYWYFTNGGDYNQDGQVAIGDLAPLGQKFGQVSPGVPGSLFPVDDWRDLIDGSRDGAVNLADLTPIGANWSNVALGYRVFSSTSMADYPASNTGPNGGGATQVGELLLADATGAAGERKRFALPLPAPDPAAYYWVRPFDDSGPGTPSDAKQPGQLDTEPPYWVDQLYTGIQAAIGKDGKVRVMYGAAEDLLSPPVDYTIYYQQGSTVDFATAQTVSVTDLSQVVDVTGLNNGQQYAFAVRAKDRAVTPNEEQNTAVLTATPTPYVDMPTLISADVVFPDPMRIPDGQTTTVTNGAHITCNNDLLIDGTLTAYDEDINLDVLGDLTLNGHIILDGADTSVPDGTEGHNINIVAQSNMDLNDTGSISPKGNLQIVDDPADQQTSQEIANDTATDQNPELYPFNLMPDDGSHGASRVVDVTRRASATQYYGPAPWTWNVTGNWGQVPTPPQGVTRIVLRVYQRNGNTVFHDWNITGPKGRKGRDDVGCTATGKPGQDGFNLRVHCANRMTFNNVTINLCDGGDGGDATAGPCCDAVAVGGKGGQPGKFRFTAGAEIRILGTFNLNPGQGGNGGLATATGKDGDPGCPGMPGCNATATGGAGADTFFGIWVRGAVNGIGNTTLGPAHGGDGGNAIATGGAGGETTCACADGAAGGAATANGGKGGNANFGALAGATGGGAVGGNGGDATANGGPGSNGTDCFKAQAGNGGAGGSADATGGAGGTATGNGPLTDGSQGAASANGGNGGNGGNGCPPGAGGAGGPATADGTPSAPVPGANGADGVEWPVGCHLWLLIVPDALVPDTATPGPIPDGFAGVADVLRTDTMAYVGKIPFHWMDPDGGHLSWVRGDTNQIVLTINNQIGTQDVGLTFDLSNATFDLSPLQLSGARLGIRWAQGPVSGIGTQETRDGGWGLVGSAPITLVPPIAVGPPELQDYHPDPPSSFFDIFYYINIAPASIVYLDGIYLDDP